MIHYDQFSFGAPPRSATSWFIKACTEVGLPDKPEDFVHNIPTKVEEKRYIVSTVRHPYDWLRSYFHAVKNMQIKPIYPFENHIHAATHNDFVRRVVLNDPGHICKLFDAYKASTVIRLEDLPWAAVGFFQTLGISRHKSEECRSLPKLNVGRNQIEKTDKYLRRMLVESEKDFCERYDYS